jgi:nucleotide-binding universal stress UspA family protein
MSLAKACEQGAAMRTGRILVAVDFTESSDRAAGEARRLAEMLGLGIAYVHVVVLPPATPAQLMARGQADLAAVDAARERLGKLVEETERDGITAESHVCVGSPVMGILDVAKRVEPILIVTGSHGKGLIARAIVGSVAESLLRRSPLPILVVPSPSRQRIDGDAAWMCGACGHIRHAYETVRCVQCGAEPAQWISAPISSEPIDAGEPAVGEIERETVDQGVRNDPAGLFATSPAGVENVDVNPELRVRY